MYKKNKIAAFVISMMLGATAVAADNSIYLDQAGDNAVIVMLQDGASNHVRGVGASANDVAAKLYGDGLNVDIKQAGSGNTLDLGAQTGTSGGVSSLIRYYAVGNNNVAIVDMNNAGSATSLANIIDVLQTGDTTATEIHMKGSNNLMQVIQTGNNNVFQATVEAGSTQVSVNQTGGNGNQTVLDLKSNNGKVDIVTVGASNMISIAQDGPAGTNGHYAKLDLTGSGNQVSVTQNGSIDMTTNIKSVGNSNSFSIIQRN